MVQFDTKNQSFHRSVFKRHSFIYERIPGTITLFYFCIAAVSSFFYRHTLTLEEYSQLDPPSFLFFIKYLSPEIMLFLSNTSPFIFLLTGIFPKIQSLRVLSCLSYLLVYGFRCSHGIDYHHQLILVYGSIALAFMPSHLDNSRRIDRHIIILYFWAFHAALLIPYFISGLSKLFYAGIYQPLFDKVSLWSPHAMAYITETYLDTIQSQSWLGEIIIHNIWLSGPMYIGATVLEISTLLPLFFPKLYKPIILKLIVFHILSNWILNILFFSNILVLLVVLYNTPFSHPLLPSLKDFWKSINLPGWKKCKSYFRSIP